MRLETKTAIGALLITSAAFLASASAISLRSNPLGIDWDPAPSPEDGPPLSRGALRDKKYLPAEIGGIVGAYAFTVAVVGLALSLVGRRLRKRIQAGKGDIELQQPVINVYETPITPVEPQNFSWPSPEKSQQNPYIFPATTRSPISSVGSDPNVDARVIQADRDNLQRGLEDIYAHVMEQEEAKAAGVVLTDSPRHLRHQPQAGLPAAAPQRKSGGKQKSKPPSLDVKAEKSHSRTSSVISSIVSPRKKGIRGMRISSPIATPLQATFPAGYGSDEEPLSPRHYTPPPPPPLPMEQYPARYSHSGTNSTDPSPISPARSIAEQLQPYNVPQHRYTPSYSSQLSQPRSTRSGAPLTSNPSGSPRPHPAPLAIPDSSTRAPLHLPNIKTSTPVNATPSNASTRTLPFRAFDPPGGVSSPSSQMTKTTVLERTTPLTPGLKTPWTAGAVPYSPYQPFTPLMPVTPRLVTKEDRKAMKKMEKKRPVLEMIKSDDELWDSSY
ncbi:MAG: hypothetical protein M1818_004756 [Claussenomyces sp. TS43310]|nr:MAG: hypothetical protein M1818_004756 [Claussenomyces sp. TS43310]